MPSNTRISHILINSHLRSGGSLLARLLDGHSELAVFPAELRYSRRKVFWPDVESVRRRRDFDYVVREFNLDNTLLSEQYDQKARNPKVQYGQSAAMFSYQEFLNGVNTRLSTEEDWDLRVVVNAVFDSFFSNWNDADGYDRSRVRFFVNHLSMMCFADPDVFFEAFPDGFIIQTIREPLGWYASMKTHLRAEHDAELFMRSSLALWYESTTRALIYRDCFPQRYLVVRYEDLVESTENVMQELACNIAIPYSLTLCRPTVGGEQWLGNSSYGEKQTVDKSSLERWKSVLTDDEVAYIKSQTSSMSEALGYQQVPRSPLNTRMNPMYNDGTELVTDFESQISISRLRNENARMASMLYAVHRYFVLDHRNRDRQSRHRQSVFRRTASWLKRKVISK